MKPTTAYKIIQKECDFLGKSFSWVWADIIKHGSMIYSEQAVQAVDVLSDHCPHTEDLMWFCLQQKIKLNNT
ncbi:hypothetical protein EBU24_02590 [bacterium]|nr:hypothetical protein [bacterium]